MTTVKSQDCNQNKFNSLWTGNYVGFLNFSSVCYTFLHLSEHPEVCTLKWIREKEPLKCLISGKSTCYICSEQVLDNHSLFLCSFRARVVTVVILIENGLMWIEKCCSVKWVFCQTSNLCIGLLQVLYWISTNQEILHDHWKEIAFIQEEGLRLPSDKAEGLLRTPPLSIISLLLRI